MTENVSRTAQRIKVVVGPWDGVQFGPWDGVDLGPHRFRGVAEV